MNFTYRAIAVFAFSLLLAGCGAYFNQPIKQKGARTGELTSTSTTLKEFPLPSEPVVVGVYNFKDQTGQYKSVENGSTFSTAVSQGATTILIKALEDSKWFTPIERENLGNLLNERNIIRSTRDEYRKNSNPNEPNLPPLLYAGVLLEGGIISYDSNIITGGLGARYFGVGGSTQYREDRITVYLRAVSTSSGKILKTVYVSKTILSQAVNASLFKYVNFQRLLEVETGFTKNEPVQLAMKDAIEKAVEALIIEGLQDKLWSTQAGEATNQMLIDAYLKEKELEESTLLYERLMVNREMKNNVSVSFGGNYPDGDFLIKRLGLMGRLEYQRKFTPNFSLGLSGTIAKWNNGIQYNNYYGSIDLNGHFDILPNDKLSPYIYGGPGLIVDGTYSSAESIGVENTYFKLQYGLGLQYFVSKRVGLKVFGEHNISFSDELDGIEIGKRDDFYFNFGLGINYYFDFKKGNEQRINPEKTIE